MAVSCLATASSDMNVWQLLTTFFRSFICNRLFALFIRFFNLKILNQIISCSNSTSNLHFHEYLRSSISPEVFISKNSIKLGQCGVDSVSIKKWLWKLPFSPSPFAYWTLNSDLKPPVKKNSGGTPTPTALASPDQCSWRSKY